MKIRAIGTGSAFCRHPLATSSFLIQSENSNVLIGCGANIPAKLETINLSMGQIDMFVVLNHKQDHIGGLEEVIHFLESRPEPKKPYLVGPGDLLGRVAEKLPWPCGQLTQSFDVRSVNKVTISEEHYTETLNFIPTDLKSQSPSYALFLAGSKIFVSGTAELNEEFIHLQAEQAELILHQCLTPACPDPHWFGLGTALAELQKLPLYLQKKFWLYGYGNDYLELEDPLPMLFLPQGTCIFDSDRKEKHLDKERFIRENSKRLIGNALVSP